MVIGVEVVDHKGAETVLPLVQQGKEVGIAGRVTNSYGAAGVGAYELDDGTGRIWVATKRGVPSRGAQVGAKGYLRSGVNFNGQNYGTVLEETDRRARGK